MSTQPTLCIPPVADPNYPNPDATLGLNTPELVDQLNGIFTSEEIDFMESVFWFWEENSPLARPFENTDPEKDGYDPNLDMLTTIRAKLAALKPS